MISYPVAGDSLSPSDEGHKEYSYIVFPLRFDSLMDMMEELINPDIPIDMRKPFSIEAQQSIFT